jgi:hypothetical protein
MIKNSKVLMINNLIGAGINETVPGQQRHKIDIDFLALRKVI